MPPLTPSQTHTFFDDGWLTLPGPRTGQVRIDRVVWAGAADATVLEYGAHPHLLAWAGQLVGARRLLINGYAHPDANTRVYPGEGAGRFLDVP